MPNDLAAAKSFATKLEDWGHSLPEAEQEVLLALMQIARRRFSDALGDLAPLDAMDPDKVLIDEAKAALERVAPDDSGIEPMTTTCVTALTVATALTTSRYLCD